MLERTRPSPPKTTPYFGWPHTQLETAAAAEAGPAAQQAKSVSSLSEACSNAETLEQCNAELVTIGIKINKIDVEVATIFFNKAMSFVPCFKYANSEDVILFASANIRYGEHAGPTATAFPHSRALPLV